MNNIVVHTLAHRKTIYDKYDGGLIGHPAAATWTDLSMLRAPQARPNSRRANITRGPTRTTKERPHMRLPFHDFSPIPRSHSRLTTQRGAQLPRVQPPHQPHISHGFTSFKIAAKNSHLKRTSALKMSYLGLCRI